MEKIKRAIMKKHFYLLISGKWKPCDRSIYLELKPEYKRIRLYNYNSFKDIVLTGIGLY